jgi:hypothetical protein
MAMGEPISCSRATSLAYRRYSVGDASYGLVSRQANGGFEPVDLVQDGLVLDGQGAARYEAPRRGIG